MKFAAVLFSCLLAVAQTPPPKPEASKPGAPPLKPDELCTLEGVVRNAVTGEPLRKVNVVASRVDPRSGQPATTSTNAEGKFAMKAIEPGQYRISADRPGLVRASYGARPGSLMGGTTLTLEKGQSMKNIEFRMSPHSVITGRVLDEDGDPVANTFVTLVRQRFMQGRKQMMPFGGASTNDLGEYRLYGIGPGKYYVSATSRNNMMNYGVDRSANAQPDEAYAPTYYPGTNDLTSASQVNVPLGGTIQGMDITLRKMRTYRIKGVVTGTRGNRGGMLFIQPKDGNDFGMDRNYSNWRGPSGEFEVRGLRPGSYVVQAEYSESPESRLSGRLPIELTDRDLTDVVVQLGPGLEVQGAVRVEGEGTLNIEDVMVSLAPKTMGPMSGNSFARVTEGGTFKIARASREEYQINVTGAPTEYYVKSARLGETEVLENGLDLTSGSSVSGLEIVLSPGAARLDGAVIDEKEKPVQGATIVLRPTKMKPGLSGTSVKTATTDQNGQFKIEAITPGEYRMLALEGWDLFESQDPDLFKEFDTGAAKVDLKEKGQETKQLKVIVRKD